MRRTFLGAVALVGFALGDGPGQARASQLAQFRVSTTVDGMQRNGDGVMVGVNGDVRQ